MLVATRKSCTRERTWRMHRIGWLIPSGVIALLLLTACETTDSRPAPRLVLPTLQQYASEFQSRLADEMEALGPDCPRDFVVEGCSALGTFTLDHIYLRDRIKAAVK